MCVICLEDGASLFGLGQRRRAARFVAEGVEPDSIAPCDTARAALARRSQPSSAPLSDDEIARRYGARRLPSAPEVLPARD